MREKRRRCAGQTLIFFALAFALLLFGMVCLVADASFLFGWSNRLQAAAQLAAQSGADAVDPRYLYSTGCSPATARCRLSVVDVSVRDRRGSRYAFERACIEAGDQSAAIVRAAGSPKTPDDAQTPDGTACDSDGCHVYAVVARALDLPVEFPGFPATITVRGSAYAAAVVGETQARVGCSGGAWVPRPPG